jgi:hypothetical protein
MKQKYAFIYGIGLCQITENFARTAVRFMKLAIFAFIPHTKNKEWPITLKKIFPAIIRENIPCQKVPLYPEIFP